MTNMLEKIALTGLTALAIAGCGSKSETAYANTLSSGAEIRVLDGGQDYVLIRQPDGSFKSLKELKETERLYLDDRIVTPFDAWRTKIK